MAYNRYLNNAIRTEHLQDDAVSINKIDNHSTKVEAFLYDGTSLTAGAKTLTSISGTAKTLPAGAIIKSYYPLFEIPTTSDGSATIAFGHTGSAASMLGATAFDNDELVAATASWTPALAPGGPLNVAKSVLMTIGTAALTAGRIVLYVEYCEQILV